MIAKLDKLSGREKLYLTIAAVFLLGLVLDRLVVTSVLARFSDVEQASEKVAAELQFNRLVLQERDGVLAQYESIKGRFGEVNVPAKAIDEMKGQVHELARKAGVVVISSEHRDPQRGEFCDEYSVELKQFKATVGELLAFLYELQAAPGMLRVVKMTVTPPVKNELRLQGAMLITKRVIPVRVAKTSGR